MFQIIAAMAEFERGASSGAPCARACGTRSKRASGSGGPALLWMSPRYARFVPQAHHGATISNQPGISVDMLLQGGSAAFRKPLTGAVVKWADSRQLGFSKKLVESKRFRQAMNIMLAANEAFETGFLSPAQLLATVRTYASDGHFDDPAREYLRHEQAPGFGIKCHAGRRDQAISDHHRRPSR